MGKKKLEFPKYFYEAVSIAAGLAILAYNYLFVSATMPFLAPYFNIVGAMIAAVPSIWLFYNRYAEKKQIEQQFIIFIRDLTQAINSGMTLPLALKYCSKKNYGPLTRQINNLTSEVDWGVPFKKALEIFAKKTRSVPIKRAVTTIIETYKVGGKISDTLNAVGKSLVEIDKIRSERTASVHAQIITSYLIYFVFIFILVVLQTFLLPALSPSENIAGIPGIVETAAPISEELYKASFINFILIQGFFAGLVTGKMAEGSIVAGFKHSVLLIVVGYTLFSFSSQFKFSIF